MNKTKLFFFTVFLTCLFMYSQVSETNAPDYIKTITFRSQNNSQGQLPILELGEAFSLEFDVLLETEPDFYYTIEHFNYDWTPSALAKMEYLTGFDNYRIVDYENSFNAYQLYSHYNLRIPNQQTKALTKTGNYLLSIFNENQELVFSRKFMIYRDEVAVGVAIKRSRDVRFIEGKQNVDIVVNTRGQLINNPLQTINAVIIQNNNLNTVIANVKPQYTLGSELIYRYTDETAFWAGNEFRFFENKNVRAANIGIQSIDLLDIYNHYLFGDIPRFDRPYTYNPDINGNFLVTALDVETVDIEADYVNMHFTLAMPLLTDGSKIFVYGNFNNYALSDENEMLFNSESNAYEVDFKLKQGFYNYKYVVLDPNGSLDEGRISGNFWQTENNYKVLIYYRDLGARFDQLIGLGEASSVDISN